MSQKLNRQACLETSVRGLVAQGAFSTSNDAKSGSFCRYLSFDDDGTTRRCAAAFLAKDGVTLPEGMWETSHMMQLKPELWEGGYLPQTQWDVDIGDRAFVREMQASLHDTLAAGPMHIGGDAATRITNPFSLSALLVATRDFARVHNLSVNFLSEFPAEGAQQESQSKVA